MGAVSRCGVLRLALSQSLFDVEQFRHRAARLAVARDGARPDAGARAAPSRRSWSTSLPLRQRGVELARRRGGGGAVYLGPGEQLWLDAWIPRDDPLWVADVSAAAEWVGAWWTDALAGAGSTVSRSTAGRVGTGRPRRPRVLRRPRAGRGVPRGGEGGGTVAVASAGRGACSPPAPTCAGIPRRCWRSWTSRADARIAARPPPGPAGGRSGRPRPAGARSGQVEMPLLGSFA